MKDSKKAPKGKEKVEKKDTVEPTKKVKEKKDESNRNRK